MSVARSSTFAFSATAPDPTRTLVVVLALVLLLLVVPPLIFLLNGSLHTTTVTGAPGDFTFAYYRRLLSDRHFFGSLANSLVFSFGSMAIALAFGGLVAWLVERTNAPFKAFAYLTAIISLGTPFVLYVIAWLFLFGRNGPLNDLITAIGLPRFNVYSMPGMILVEGFLWSPLAFLLLSSVFAQANAEYEEAARMSGAGILRTVTRISMRLALPAFLAVALADRGALDRGLRGAGAGRLARQDQGFDHRHLSRHEGERAARSRLFQRVLHRAVAARRPADRPLFAHLAPRLALSQRHRAQFSRAAGRSRPGALSRRRHHPVQLFADPADADHGPGLARLDAVHPRRQPARLYARHLDNFRTVLHSTFYIDLVWQTLLMSAGAATCVMALTVVAGWLAVRRRPGAWLLDQLATAPLIFPGIVLGVAMIQIYLSVPVAIYGTLWAFIIAFTIRFLPYGMRYAASGILQIHPELEEAAAIAGSPLRTALRRIVVPLATPALLAGWLFIFLVAARDLSLAVILASPKAQPVSVAMFDLWANGQGTELAAFGLVWTAIMTVIAAGFYLIGRRTIAFAVRA